MTKPTDRQIEAAKAAFRNASFGLYVEPSGEAIEAALTAAAEVGETERDLRWEADMRAIKKWQAATGKTLIWPDHTDLCIWLMNELAAAIERCAQVADRLMVPGVAEEIRALKDKP